MAGETSGQPIGEARVDFRANLETLKQDVAAAAPAIKQEAEKLEQTTAPAAANTGKIKDEGERGNATFTAMAAKVSVVAGAVAHLYDGLKQAMDAARQLGVEMDAIEQSFRGDIMATLDPLARQREAIEATARAQRQRVEDLEVQRNIVQDLVELAHGEATSQVRLQKIEQERLDAQRRLAEQAAEQEAQARKRALDEYWARLQGIYAESTKLARQNATEEEQIMLALADKRVEIDARVRRAATEDERTALRSLLEEHERASQFRIEKIRSEAAERERREIEANEKIARSAAQAMQDAMNRVLSEGLAKFNTDNIVTAIENVGDQVSIAVQKLDRI